MLLQNVALLLFGAQSKPFPTLIHVEPLRFMGLQISFITMLTILVSAGLMVMLQLFIKTSKSGKAMRAVSEDYSTAQLMGINVDTTITLTFAIGCALAGIGAFLYTMAYPAVSPTMGSLPGLKAFIAAVLGGIGLIPGAMLGGFVMGIVESLTKAYISTQMSDAVVYGILIIVLLVKPTGLLGSRMFEKV
jgi:branched-chain amino acid transport system permease protein